MPKGNVHHREYLIQLTLLNVFINNFYMLVPVRSRMLVPEPNNVPQLVHHNPKFVAVFAYGYCLRSTAAPPNV